MSAPDVEERADFCVDNEMMKLVEDRSLILDEETLALIRHLLFTAKSVDLHSQQDESSVEEAVAKFRKWALAQIAGGPLR